MSTVIAIANQKGGVGKTASAVILSAALAMAGKRVLLVDLDAQASATLWLLDAYGEESRSAFDVLTPVCRTWATSGSPEATGRRSPS